MQVDHGPLTLLQGEATSTGDVFDTSQLPAERTYHAYVDGTGAVSATIIVDVSNDRDHWIPVYIFSLSGTASDYASNVGQHRWAYTRARITAISGTSAIAGVNVGA